MKVCEIFKSIQGESTHAGLPCTFVRLTGCNLRCTYCDTAYAYEEGAQMSIEEIVREVRKYGIPLVEITGGEPLIEGAVFDLMDRLIAGGYKVLVETNGSVSLKGMPPKAIAIMDIKTPGSGMSAKMDMGNISLLRPHDEVKFVITSREDYLWARGIMERYSLPSICTVLMAPAFGMVEPRTLVSWILEDSLPVRLNLQLHKIIFNPTERGV